MVFHGYVSSSFTCQQCYSASFSTVRNVSKIINDVLIRIMDMEGAASFPLFSLFLNWMQYFYSQLLSVFVRNMHQRCEEYVHSTSTYAVLFFLLYGLVLQ